MPNLAGRYTFEVDRANAAALLPAAPAEPARAVERPEPQEPPRKPAEAPAKAAAGE